MRFINEENGAGPQIAFYPSNSDIGAIYFNIRINKKDIILTRINETGWETLFTIKGE